MNKELELIKEALDDAKLKDISLYDLENTNPFYNYVFISTADNKRQLQAVLKYIDEKNISYEHIEGKNNSDWILIDCLDILINVLLKDAREMYSLDKLYISFKKLI